MKITTMTDQDFTAIEVIRGDNQNECTLMLAWAQIIKSGYVWKMPSSYQKTANAMLKEGIITPEGHVTARWADVV